MRRSVEREYRLLNRQRMDLIPQVESVVKIGAIFLGGWWTWIGFIRKRVRHPSANIEHDVKMWTDAGLSFIHLTVRVTNRGSVLVRLGKGCAWVEQLAPLPPAIQDSISGGDDIVQPGRVDAEWLLLQKRDLAQDHLLEIDPGETDQIEFDFAIDASIRRVLIYSYLANTRRRTGGWNLNTIHEIPTTALL